MLGHYFRLTIASPCPLLHLSATGANIQLISLPPYSMPERKPNEGTLRDKQTTLQKQLLFSLQYCFYLQNVHGMKEDALQQVASEETMHLFQASKSLDHTCAVLKTNALEVTRRGYSNHFWHNTEYLPVFTLCL